MTKARFLWLVAPYAVWMALMAVLPQTACCYALRGIATLAVFAVGACRGEYASAFRRSERGWLPAGVGAGLAVFVVWIAPEMWLGVGTPVTAAESPYSPLNCGWGLALAKLAASAFVIPVAEELFFRKWLVDFAGFWWMVALFAVEHGERWYLGAAAGVAYGLVAKRFGLRAAVVAHVFTNLCLGILVLHLGRWQFW